jgi:cytochrome o ubiquinol oxidase subunit 2
MLLIVVPVFVLTFWIAWRYRAGNTQAKYTPNWEHNATEEFIWWAVPSIIVIFLASITWTSSHRLDPYKPISGEHSAMTIQVVALDWKWLFIYPVQGIATVNFVEFPTDTPIDFHITADAPMNSLWIPQLAGQIYAMPGMMTELHMITNLPGDYRGTSANFSGPGFSGMTFTARAVSSNDFDSWVRGVRTSSSTLDMQAYTGLSAPSANDAVRYYANVAPKLFESIVMRYMSPASANSTSLSPSNLLQDAADMQIDMHK